jgi:hypothetical protein
MAAALAWLALTAAWWLATVDSCQLACLDFPMPSAAAKTSPVNSRQSLKGPLVANMVEGGVTPIVEREHLGRLGFSIVLDVDAARAAGRRRQAILRQH